MASLDKKSQDYISKGSGSNTVTSSSSFKSTTQTSSSSLVRKRLMNQNNDKKVHFEINDVPVTPLMKVPQRSILKSPKHQSSKQQPQQVQTTPNSIPSTPTTKRSQQQQVPFIDRSNQQISFSMTTPLSKPKLTSPLTKQLTPSSSGFVSTSLKESPSSSGFKFQYKKENEILTKFNETTNTDQWTNRVLLIEQLSTILEEGRDSVKKLNFSKIISKILDGLTDSHYRVVLETLNCLMKSISNYKIEFEEYLEK